MVSRAGREKIPCGGEFRGPDFVAAVMPGDAGVGALRGEVGRQRFGQLPPARSDRAARR